jgi:hypothetical protein
LNAAVAEASTTVFPPKVVVTPGKGHRIVDLQVDIFAAAARTKRGLRVVERRNDDPSLCAIDKRIKAARKGGLRKRLKVDDDTAARDGHGELRTQIGPELRRRQTPFCTDPVMIWRAAARVAPSSLPEL